jgi:hypothetical protein
VFNRQKRKGAENEFRCEEKHPGRLRCGRCPALVLQIDDWGIDARSPVAAVSLHVRMLASLYPVDGNELAWRREITVDQPADPDMFGIGPIIGNMVTATVLYNMTPEDLTQGFKHLASLTARRIARDLEDDLDYARFGR